MALRFRLPRQGNNASRGFRDKPAKGPGRVVGFLFGLPFLAAGLGFGWFMGGKPLVLALTSGGWPELPCVITSSEVESVSGSDGTTYKVDIEFRYEFEGRSYTGGSYDFSTASSSGRAGKQKVVDRFPVGAEAECFVNPDDPEQAVLSRDIPGIVFFALPFSSIFVLVGLGLSLASVGCLPKSWKNKVRSRHRPVEDTGEGSRELKPQTGPLAKLLVSIGIAVFWNGIVSVFLFQLFDGFREGDPEWFLLVFLTPFVLIGLGMIGAIVYYACALGNPRFTLTLTEARPRLGDIIGLSWRSNGSPKRLKHLRIYLEGRECATYRRGTDSVTDHSLFFQETVYQNSDAAANASGQIDLAIPAGLMHSFDGGNNKIEWRLRIHGPIHRWPDVDEVYPVTVRPLASASKE